MSNLSRRALLAGAGLLAAGAARAASPEPQPAPPAAPVIGAALPLSGDLSLIGDECRRGIQLAADTVDQAGGIAGKPVALVTADAFSPAQATAAVNGLITAHHAGLVLSAGASTSPSPARPRRSWRRCHSSNSTRPPPASPRAVSIFCSAPRRPR